MRKSPLLGAIAALTAGLACGLLGCGADEPTVDPNTQRLRGLIAQLKDGSVTERWQAAKSLGQSRDSRVIASLTQALSDSSPTVRMTAASALAKFGAPALKPLLAALDANDTAAREAGAYALGSLGSPAAVEPLIAALDDAEPPVRAAAAEALGRLADKRAVPRLLEALTQKEDVPGVCQAAINALGEIADPDSARRLVGMLSGRDRTARRTAPRALVKMGRAAVGPLCEALQNRDVSVRTSAAEALGEIGHADAIGPLVAVLRDRTATVARAHGAVVAALVAIGGEKLTGSLLPALASPNSRARAAAARIFAERGDRRAVPALVAALKADPTSSELIRTAASFRDRRATDVLLEIVRSPAANKGWPSARTEAIRALGEIGDPKAAGPLLAELKRIWAGLNKQRKYEKVLDALCSAMGKLRYEPAAGILIEATALERDSYAFRDVRAAAARALGHLGQTKAIAALADCAKDAEGGPRAAALEALGLLNDAGCVEPLLGALTDRNRTVRGAAAVSLVQLGALSLPALLDKLGSKDRALQSAVVGVLAKIGQPAYAPVLQRLKGAEPAVRQGAAWALGTMGDRRAVEPLIEALRDADVDVRGAAVWALRKLGDRRAVEPLIRAMRDANHRVRGEAIYTLSMFRAAEAIDPILGSLDDPNAEVRRAAAAALGELGQPRFAEPLHRLVEAETDRLARLRARLEKAGKLDRKGQVIKGKILTKAEQRSIAMHMSVRGAARSAIEEIQQKAKARPSGKPGG